MAVSRKGFTLIELLIVIIIVGVLATLAIPQYTGFVEKSRAAEALSTIAAMKTAQASNKLDNGYYTTNINDLAETISSIKTSSLAAASVGQLWYYTAGDGGLTSASGYQFTAKRSSKNPGGQDDKTITFTWSDTTGATWGGTHPGRPR